MTQNDTGGTGAQATALSRHHSLGLPEGAGVLTLDGVLPVEYLSPGDRIITRDGARVLRALRVSVLSRVAVIRVGSSTLGHGRPEDALHLLPDQLVLIRDWRAKALFGMREALVPLRRLADGEHIRSERVACLRLWHLAFAGAEIVYAGGLELGTRSEAPAGA